METYIQLTSNYGTLTRYKVDPLHNGGGQQNYGLFRTNDIAVSGFLEIVNPIIDFHDPLH